MILSSQPNYAQIYLDVFREIQKRNLWRGFAKENLKYIGIFIVGVFLYQFVFIGSESLSHFLGGSIAAILIIGALFLFYFLIEGLFLTSQPAFKEVAFTTVYLLVLVPRSLGREGLNQRDLEHLRNVALIEQGAASWRAAVIGLVLALLAFISYQIIPFIDNFPPTSLSYSWLNLITAFLIFIVLVWLGISLIQAYVAFIWSETINRTILFACNDASALLNNVGFSDTSPLGQANKRLLAYQTGCYYYKRKDQPTPAKKKIVFQNPDGYWLFPMPVGQKKRPSLRRVFSAFILRANPKH